MRLSWMTAVVAFAIAISARPAALVWSAAPAADLIVVHGAVYSFTWPDPDGEGKPASTAPFDRTRGWHSDAQAIAVRAGRIVLVGSDSAVLRLKGPSTRVIDARGATVLPGLADSHVHLANLGESLSLVNLVGVSTPDE